MTMIRPLFHALLTLTLVHSAAAQCKYEFDEVDAISGQRTFKTKAIRLHEGVKVKGELSAGFLDMKLAGNGNTRVLELHVMVKNPRGHSLTLRVPEDSLTIKFVDNSVLSLPSQILPKRYTNAVSGKPMVAFSYIISDDLAAKFRKTSVAVLRILVSDQKWDFTGLKNDPAQIFRDCSAL